MTSRHFSVDHAGDGEPVVFLHGYPHDRSLWWPQLAAVPDGFRYYTIDLPGYGGSARVEPATLDDWADWLAKVMDNLGVQRAAIAGLSMGGYLALAFWRRHPERVRALVLADTRAGADTDEARAKRREAQALAQREGAGAIAEQMITGMVGKTTRAGRPEVVAKLDEMMRRASVTAIVDTLDALMARFDSTAMLPTITVPTLVVCGEEDAITPVAESRTLHAGIKGSRLEVIPGAGHVSNFEQPEAFNRLLSDFLGATIRTGPT